MKNTRHHGQKRPRCPYCGAQSHVVDIRAISDPVMLKIQGTGRRRKCSKDPDHKWYTVEITLDALKNLVEE